MRVRLFVVLLAFVAMAAIPSEAVLADNVGSVVGQVASCIEPSGLLREGGSVVDASAECPGFPPVAPTPIVVVVLTTIVLALLVASNRSRTDGPATSGQRWRISDASVRCGVPWRAPPRPV